MRVALDIDSRNRLRLLMAYFNLRHLFPKHPIRVRDSAHKHGYHILAYGAKLTREQSIIVRDGIGDDPAHTQIDRETLDGYVHKPFLIMYTSKGQEGVEEIDPLAEPWKLVRNRIIRGGGKKW